jgi:hypothetical protein
MSDDAPRATGWRLRALAAATGTVIPVLLQDRGHGWAAILAWVVAFLVTWAIIEGIAWATRE